MSVSELVEDEDEEEEDGGWTWWWARVLSLDGGGSAERWSPSGSGPLQASATAPDEAAAGRRN